MYPQLVERLIEDAEGQLQEGHKLTLGRRVHNFYEPIVAAQTKYGNSPLIKYALNETLHHGALRKPKNRAWTAYFETVLQNNEKSFKGGSPTPGTNAAAKAAASPDALSKRLHERLAEAYGLNKDGKGAQAQVVLVLLLDKALPLLVPALFDGDAAVARAAVIEAFKRGSSDGLRREPDDPKFAAVDYLPESTWPHAARLVCEVAASSEEKDAPAPSPTSPALAASSQPVSPVLDDERAPLPTAAFYDAADDENLPDEFWDAPAAKQPEQEAIGTQLVLDGSDGPELVKEPNGKLTYRETKPAVTEPASVTSTAVTQPAPTPDHMAELRERFGVVEEMPTVC